MSYRLTRNYENLNKAIFEGVAKYDIPAILPEKMRLPREFIGFNFMKTEKEPYTKGLHFFVDDYQFSRVWENPDAYLEQLGKFKVVCAPDFSTYTDFSKAIQIYNHYRKHWLAAYWQHNGITVIPTISWSDEKSFEWCFDGEPEKSIVAVSSVGTQINPESKRLFKLGYDEMLKRLQPETILFYGVVPEGFEGNIISLTAFQEQIRKRVAANGR
ncbi:MAG: DUF4417 domain-containing protein [Clostridia bacterium]|nr:DUF4417 domain-containing protein [Clostridia bacterium]